MRISVFCLCVLVVISLPLQGGEKKIEWRNLESVQVLSQDWVVTQQAGTVMVPIHDSVPCPPPPVVIPPPRGQIDSTIPMRTCVPTITTRSIPVQAREQGYFQYRLETTNIIYTVAAPFRLNLTINGRTGFGWDKKKVYVVQDGGGAVEVTILQKEAKTGNK